jgi:uncharacterized damage-inducible protein DinB
MISPDYAQRMATYNQCMNQKLYEVSAALGDAERKLDRGAFFGSIHGTLNHLLLADKIWMGRFEGRPFLVEGLDQILYQDFAELRHERERTDARIILWANNLMPADLAGELHYEGISRPGKRNCKLWLAITHLFNHQTHHRGQLTTLLLQAGSDPGVTDLIAMPGMVLPI